MKHTDTQYTTYTGKKDPGTRFSRDESQKESDQQRLPVLQL